MAGTTNYYTFVQAETWQSLNYNRSIGATPASGVTISDLGWTPPGDGVLVEVTLSGTVLDGVAISTNTAQLSILHCDRASFSSSQTVTEILNTPIAFNFSFGPTPPHAWSTSVPLSQACDRDDSIIVSVRRNNATNSSTNAYLNITFTYVLNG
jgi:hypothetical protein